MGDVRVKWMSYGSVLEGATGWRWVWGKLVTYGFDVLLAEPV